MQALGDAERQSYMKGKRILEINPRHPLIQQVKDKFEADPENAANGALAKILYETALLESGFQVRSCMSAYGAVRKQFTAGASSWIDSSYTSCMQELCGTVVIFILTASALGLFVLQAC